MTLGETFFVFFLYEAIYIKKSTFTQRKRIQEEEGRKGVVVHIYFCIHHNFVKTLGTEGDGCGLEIIG